MQGKGDFKELRIIQERATNIVFANKKNDYIIQAYQKKRTDGKIQILTTNDGKETICAGNDITFPALTTNVKPVKKLECLLHSSLQVDRPNKMYTMDENINSMNGKILLPFNQSLESVNKDSPTVDVNRAENYNSKNQETKNPLNSSPKGVFKTKASLLGCNKLKLKSIFSLFQCVYSNKKNNIIQDCYVNNNNYISSKTIMKAIQSATGITSTHKLNEETCLINRENISSHIINHLTRSNMNVDKEGINKITKLSEERKIITNFNREYQCHYVYVNMDCIQPDGSMRKTHKIHNLQKRKKDKVGSNLTDNDFNKKYSISKPSAKQPFKEPPYIVVNSVPKSYYKFLKDINSKPEAIEYNIEKTPRNIEKNITNKSNPICEKKTSKTRCANNNEPLPESSRTKECGASFKNYLTSLKSNFILKAINGFRKIFQNNEKVVLQYNNGASCDKPLLEMKIDPITKRILNAREVSRKLKPLKKQHFIARETPNHKSNDKCKKSKEEEKMCHDNELWLSPSNHKGPLFEVKLDRNNMQILNYPEVLQKIRNLNCQNTMKSESKASDRKSSNENHNIGLKKANSKYLRDVRSKISCLWTQFTCKHDFKSKHSFVRSGSTDSKRKVTYWKIHKNKKDKKAPKSLYLNCKKNKKTKKLCKKNFIRNHRKKKKSRTDRALQFLKNARTCGLTKKVYSSSNQCSRTTIKRQPKNKRRRTNKACRKKTPRHQRRDQISYRCQYGHLRETNKTCLWLYIICPSMYRSCLAMKKIVRHFARYLFIIMALVAWLPCVLVLDILQGCCCF